MEEQQPEPHGWQRMVHRVTSSRPGAWFFSYTLHHIDRVFIRFSNGRFSATSILGGVPIVMLTTLGAKSGELRTVPLIGIPDGDNIVLIASNWGGSHHPAWYHNLRAHSEATLSIRGHTGVYIAREAIGADHENYWRRAVNLYSGYAAYKRRAVQRKIPVIVLTPQKGLTHHDG